MKRIFVIWINGKRYDVEIEEIKEEKGERR